jgi:hypothetical protein
MRLEEHFESSSTLQRHERVKLAASFWNYVGAGGYGHWRDGSGIFLEGPACFANHRTNLRGSN